MPVTNEIINQLKIEALNLETEVNFTEIYNDMPVDDPYWRKRKELAAYFQRIADEYQALADSYATKNMFLEKDQCLKQRLVFLFKSYCLNPSKKLEEVFNFSWKRETSEAELNKEVQPQEQQLSDEEFFAEALFSRQKEEYAKAKYYLELAIQKRNYPHEATWCLASLHRSTWLEKEKKLNEEKAHELCDTFIKYQGKESAIMTAMAYWMMSDIALADQETPHWLREDWNPVSTPAKHAANLGLAVAQVRLADFYIQGKANPPKPNPFHPIFSGAVHIYEDDDLGERSGVRANKHAIALYKKAIAQGYQGYLKGADELFEQYKKNNSKQAIEFLQEIADQGYSPYQYKMYQNLFEGKDGMDKDIAGAALYLHKAAKNGDTDAIKRKQNLLSTSFEAKTDDEKELTRYLCQIIPSTRMLHFARLVM